MKHKLVITESQYEVLLNILNEQVPKRQRTSAGKVGIDTGDITLRRDTRGSEAKNLDSKSGVSTTIPEDQWDSYLAQNEKKLIKYFVKHKDPVSARRFLDIKNIDKKFAVAFLETFLSAKWEKVTLTKRDETVETPPTTGGTDSFPGIQVSLPTPGEPSNDFFVNNEWILTDKFKTMFAERVVGTINDGKAQIKAQFPNATDETLVYLQRLTINTSCSTLPNGIPKNSPGAEKYKNGITFIQLSTERNNATRQYVLEVLKQNNVLVDEISLSNITQNPNGDNTGNLLGTSGPTWDSNLSDAQKRQLAPRYEQYKKTEVSLDLSFNNKVDPTPSSTSASTPTVITNRYYAGRFYRDWGHEGGKIRIKIMFKKHKWSINKDFNKCSLKKHPLRRLFGKKPWWEDPKLGYK